MTKEEAEEYAGKMLMLFVQTQYAANILQEEAMLFVKLSGLEFEREAKRDYNEPIRIGKRMSTLTMRVIEDALPAIELNDSENTVVNRFDELQKSANETATLLLGTYDAIEGDKDALVKILSYMKVLSKGKEWMPQQFKDKFISK